eukprot:TRINITY_DN7025_c0_g1_i1.p1 TRINITY_DN7025_c0_g1~~TRINITY_DN7025_c0_g1_i1.p1  ORF type:complete len:854 (+),score=179.53 TRINITY_DN7025_c0_g1_i1:79-2640(+)
MSDLSDQDSDSEFQDGAPSFKGFGRKRSKEQAIYGIFDESDEDEGEQRSFRTKGKKDSTAGISFVKSDVLQPGADEEKKKKRDDSDDSGDDHSKDADESREWRPTMKSRASDVIEIDEEDDEDEAELNHQLSSMRRKFSSNSQNASGNSKQTANTPVRGFFRTKEKDTPKEKQQTKTTPNSKGLSYTELQQKYDSMKYSNGFALKMMAKMNFSGRLGVKEDGIDRPIEVALNDGRKGLGASKKRRPEQPITKAQEEQMKQAEQKQKEKEQPVGWKRGAKVKTKIEYQSADKILNDIRQQKQKIVIKDMRGPEVRMATLDGLMTMEEIETLGNNNCKELLYNIRYLKDTTEIEIQKVDGNIRKTKDRLENLSKNFSQLSLRMEKQSKRIECFDKIQEVIQPLIERRNSKDSPLTLDEVLSKFSLIKSMYPEEFNEHSMPQIACALAAPLFAKLYHLWKPSQEPEHGYDVFFSWKKLLNSKMDDLSAPFCRLVSDILLPKFRSYFVNDWHARDCGPAVDLIMTWKSLLPDIIFNNMIDMLVLPKLRAAVDSWNPRMDPVPIHLWLHPWLPILGYKIEPLHQSIKYHMGHVLQAWHPSDPSAHAVLVPWKNVFDVNSLDALIRSLILPKLIHEMKSICLIPAQLYIDPFHWLMTWRDVFPVSVISTILDGEFFPKWFSLLLGWLNNHPNYEEIGNWYRHWKSLFPPDVREAEPIRRQFTRALDLINQSMDGETILSATSQVTSMDAVPPPLPPGPPPMASNQTSSASASTARPSSIPTLRKVFIPEYGASLKDEVQRLSEESNVMFVPKKSSHDGKQVYQLGDLSIYLDKDVVFIKEKGSWFPMALEDLFLRVLGE